MGLKKRFKLKSTSVKSCYKLSCFRQVKLLEKLGDGGGWGWSVFADIKDWQGQSTKARHTKGKKGFYFMQ